jgi:hypothetical protein
MGCAASTATAAGEPGAAGEHGVNPNPTRTSAPIKDPQSYIGTEIIIKDLERRSDLNGHTAKVEHYIEQRQRFMCKVESTGETISISEDKIEKAS